MSETVLTWDSALALSLLLQRLSVARSVFGRVPKPLVRAKTREHSAAANLFVAKAMQTFSDEVQAKKDAYAVRRQERKHGLAVFTRVKV